MKMRKILALLSLFFPVLATAQTDYDISVFLENARQEVPRSDYLDFYLNAGNRLLREGRGEDADVFFDFAASLGSEDGFRGKASSRNDTWKDYYQAFSERRTPGVDRLMTALAAAKTDVSAAILVHDNLEAFRLVHLRDPLLDWMPATGEDSLWLRRNDRMAYMIAKVKEDAGNRMDALLLYEMAAWEGNYEALKEARVIGTAKERKWKDVLIGRMEKKKEFVILHKYLAGEELTAVDYKAVQPYMSTEDEKLVAYALGVTDVASDYIENTQDLLARAMTAAINVEIASVTEVDDEIQHLGKLLNESGSFQDAQRIREEQDRLAGELKTRTEELKEWNRAMENSSPEKPITPGLEQFHSSVDIDIESLRRYIADHPRAVYSKQAVSFIKDYYTKHPEPWADRILRIVGALHTNKKARYSRGDNLYYPLYERGLLSRLHHSGRIRPEQLNLGL